MKNVFFLLILISTNQIAICQDKDAVARVHYTNAEEAFNKGTKLGAENCIGELEKAERTLGTTNSKILYLKIKALDKFYDGFYDYDKIVALKKFFKLTDAKTFPADKYADIIKINRLDHWVQDTAFETKMRDSVYLNNNPSYLEYSPFYKFTPEAQYIHGGMFRSESYLASKGHSENMENDEGYIKANMYFRFAADKGHTSAMLKLGDSYLNGTGEYKDYPKALEWYLKAEKKGDTTAISNILSFYEIGTLSKEKKEFYEKLNGQEILGWCKMIAEKGNKKAMFVMARIYDEGLGGVQRDNYQAMDLYIKAYDPNDNGDRELSFLISNRFMDNVNTRSQKEEKDKKLKK